MNWRALLAGGVFVAMLIAAVFIARRDSPGADEPLQPSPQPSPPVIAAPIAPLSRGDLIDAAARAAAAQAQGAPTPAEVGELAGRRFTLRLPFGCTGPAEPDSQAPMRWSYDPAQETLRAWVTPEIWTEAAPVRAAAQGIEFEAAEGFWIRWPWLRAGGCPVLPQPVAEAVPAEPAEGNAAAADTTPPERGVAERQDDPVNEVPADRETLALVELFEPGSRRAARRNGRPYTVVAKLAPGEIDLAQGLRLVVSGRLVSLRGGTPIVCSSASIDERPLCLIGAQIDRVAITDASERRILGEWGG